MKCSPYKSVSFKDGKISLKDWVDEWREPQQSEENYNETSLFDSFNITVEDLESVIRKLLNSKKAENFSKKFGKEMLNLYTEKINSGDEDTKMEYLTKSCKNGTFINFCDKIDKEDKGYFLDELIRYGTLTETEVQRLNLMYNKNALSNLIKNKRCTHLSLKWANEYFNGNMVRRVYHSLPDDILSLEYFEGLNVREVIFENIRNVEGLTKEFVNYQIKNGIVNNNTLDYLWKDKDLFEKCLEIMIKNDRVNNDTLGYVQNNKELFEKCLENLIKNNMVDNDTLDYVRNDKELLRKCVDILISKNRVNTHTLKYVKFDKESLRKCVDYLISKDKIIYLDILESAQYDEESLRKCVDYFISKNRVENGVLKYVKHDEELMRKCVDNLILNNKVDDYTLNLIGYAKNSAELNRKCIEYLISKNRIYSSVLEYASSDKELLRKCVDYLISKNQIDRKTLSVLFSLDNNMSMIKKVLIYLADKNEVHEIYFALDYRDRFDEKDITTLCKILDEREMNDVLRGLLSYEDTYRNYYIRLYKEILKRCSSSTKMISCHMLFDRGNLHTDKILNITFKNSEDDESILKNLVKCFISSGYKSYFNKALNDDYEGRYALYYLVNDLEKNSKGDYFEKCIENIEEFENTYKDFISFLKQNKEYSERAEMWLEYPLFGETEEKDKITQMRNLYKLFERKYKENDYERNEEIVDIIREMVDIGFYKRIKTSYGPIVALVEGDNIPEDNVKLIEEILKQIGEENYNDILMSYMTWNKKLYKFIPHIVDVLMSKNDIGASLMDIIHDDEIIDVNSAKKLANWIIKNKNTIDKETKMSVNYVKENHPEIYKELFGDKL